MTVLADLAEPLYTYIWVGHAVVSALVTSVWLLKALHPNYIENKARAIKIVIICLFLVVSSLFLIMYNTIIIIDMIIFAISVFFGDTP
jgi:hypothetical protein